MPGISELKKVNIQKIRSCFYEEKNVWTRPALAEKTGLSMAGVLNILKLLISRNEIRLCGEAESTGGRKSKKYELNPDYGHLGIYILKHQKKRYMISFSSRNLCGEEVKGSDADIHSAELQEILGACRQMAASDPLLRCLIVSVPALVRGNGELINSDFPALDHVHLEEELYSILKLPVCIENDVNLAAAGYAGMHPECSSLAVLYQPDQDPAGSGIIIHGQVYRGMDGAAGEIGQPGKEEQMALLKKDPRTLVARQLSMLAGTLAPERIAWCCPSVDAEIKGAEISSLIHPVVEKLDGLDELLWLGGEATGKKMILADGSL